MKIDTYKSLLSKFCVLYPDSCISANRKIDSTIDSPPVGDDGELTFNPLCEGDGGIPGTVFEMLPICGCGNPDIVIEEYLKALKWIDSPFVNRAIDNPHTNDPFFLTLLYCLNDRGLASHGASVYGSFLTDKGVTALEILSEWKRIRDDKSGAAPESSGKQV